MKVYCVEVSGGSHEDYYCYNDGIYMSKEKAENRKEELDKELSRLTKLEEIVSNCDIDDITDEKCGKCMACKNLFSKVYDYQTYIVKEIDVIE